MKIYEIATTQDEEVVGNTNNYRQLELTSYCNLKQGEKPVDIECLKFLSDKNTRKTNVLSQAGVNFKGFVIDLKLQLFFKKCIIKKFWLVPVEILSYNKETVYLNEYSWIHLSESITDLESINWDLSIFNIKEFTEIIGEIKFSSFNDYLEKKKELGIMKIIKPKHIVLSGDFNDLDVFTLPRFSSSIYVKENIKIEIEEMGITGFEFVEVDIETL
jgi:hypothetical protein